MILVDATPLQSEHRTRGVGTYVRHLSQALIDLAGDDVRFVATRADASLLPAAVRERAAWMTRGHRPAQVYWLYNEWSLRRVLWAERPDVFLSTDFNGLIRTPGGATIAIVYDVAPLRLGLSYRGVSQALSAMRWQVYYKKLARAYHILTISETVREDVLRHLPVDASRVTALPPGFDAAGFVGLAESGRFANNPPYMAYVGGADDNKNVPRLLRAFAQVAAVHPTVQLYLGGRWQAAQMEALHRDVQTLGLVSRVVHHGFLSDADLRSLYGHATASVFVSLEEGLGIPILEAMACGVPVITSDCSVMPETAAGAALLVDPHDEAAIANGMLSMLNDESLRAACRDKGLRRVDHVSWSAVARAVLDCVAGAGGGAR